MNLTQIKKKLEEINTQLTEERKNLISNKKYEDMDFIRKIQDKNIETLLQIQQLEYKGLISQDDPLVEEEEEEDAPHDNDMHRFPTKMVFNEPKFYRSALRHPKKNSPSLVTTIPKALVDELGLNDDFYMRYECIRREASRYDLEITLWHKDEQEGKL